MEINVPTASPFFTGIPNQIMYCISTPSNLPAAWNATNNAVATAIYSNDLQKKPENASSIIQPQAINANTQLQQPAQTTQYYYSTTTASAIQPAPPSFNHTYSTVPTLSTIQSTISDTKNPVSFVDGSSLNKNSRDERFYNEDGRNFECVVVSFSFILFQFIFEPKLFTIINLSVKRNFGRREHSCSTNGFMSIYVHFRVHTATRDFVKKQY